MTKRRRKEKVPSNKGTMIEYVTDQNRLKKLRSFTQSTESYAKIASENVIKSCFFCEDPITKLNSNDSHLIPESFLRKIAVNEFGKDKVCAVTLSNSLKTGQPENFFNSKLGVGSASIFFGICGNCDGPEFKEYENKPTSELTPKKMREIALKTLLAFRYSSLFKAFDSFKASDLYIKEAYEKFPLISESLIDKRMSTNKAILELKDSCEINFSRAHKMYAEALRIKRNEMSFSKIVDFVINCDPVVAIQSFYICGERIVYVNLFPIDGGIRVVIFKNSDSAPKKTIGFF